MISTPGTEAGYVDSEDPNLVNFSGQSKARKIIKDKASSPTSADIDLASGYHRDMVWVTRDGRRIPIPNLSDQHLINIINFMHSEEFQLKHKRRIALLVAIKGVSTIKSMSIHYILSQPEDPSNDLDAPIREYVDKILSMPYSEFLEQFIPQYSQLYREAYKRHLTLPTLKVDPGDH